MPDELESPWWASAAGFNSKGEPLIPIQLGGTPYGAIKETARVIGELDITSEEAEQLISTIGRMLRVIDNTNKFFTRDIAEFTQKPSLELLETVTGGRKGHKKADALLVLAAEKAKGEKLRWSDLRPLVASANGYGSTEDLTIQRRLNDRYRELIGKGKTLFR